MKAIGYRDFGRPDVLQLEDADTPVPGDDDALVAVRAASLNALDWFFVRGTPSLMRPLLRRQKPLRPGRDLAGVVEAVGKNVTAVQRGDAVFGCARGTLAEYATAPAKFLAPMPAKASFAQAACLGVAAITALQALRDHGRLQPGQRVAINGAAGGVGTFAVQIAKALGAAHIAGVCSARNAAMVRSLGADRVFDYAKENFTRSGERYDLIVDLAATHSFPAYRRILTPAGRVVAIGAGHDAIHVFFRMMTMLRDSIWSKFTKQTMSAFIAKLSKDDFLTLRALVDDGKVTPYIDRSYPLSQAAEAMRHLSTGHASGKIVVTMESQP